MDRDHAKSQSRWKHNAAAIVVRRRRAVVLRAWRIKASLTVEQVAETLGHQSIKIILALEEGLGDLGRERVLRLARIYGVDHVQMLRVFRTGSVD